MTSLRVLIKHLILEVTDAERAEVLTMLGSDPLLDLLDSEGYELIKRKPEYNLHQIKKGQDVFQIRVHKNGMIEFLKNNRFHRDDGPAAELADGTKFWYVNGQLHCTDGPAVEYANGTKEWWVNGAHVTQQQHEELTGHKS